MDREKLWLRFVITGKAEDYIAYKNSNKSTDESGVEDYSFYNRRTGDRSEQRRG